MLERHDPASFLHPFSVVVCAFFAGFAGGAETAEEGEVREEIHDFLQMRLNSDQGRLDGSERVSGLLVECCR